MKLGVVLRSVAVLLAAPLLALPAGGAEDAVPPPPARALVTPPPMLVPETAPEPLAQPPRAVALDVRVDCAHDGCVVVHGLDVRVVGP